MAAMESLDEDTRIIYDGVRAPHVIPSAKVDLRCGGIPNCAAFLLIISAASEHHHEVTIYIGLSFFFFGLFIDRPNLTQQSFFLRNVRRPLRKYVGMEFVDVKISLYKLSLKFTKIQILPVDSPVFQGLFAALFPSAIVRRYDASDEYPRSKISIEKLNVQIRMRLTGSHGGHTGASTTLYLWIKQCMRPIISVELSGVTLEVEKAYLAPHSPPEFVADAQDSLPSAISPSFDVGPEIPVFDDRYYMDFLSSDELRDADKVTFWIERWSECICCFIILSRP
jgi:hypothetical protein